MGNYISNCNPSPFLVFSQDPFIKLLLHNVQQKRSTQVVKTYQIQRSCIRLQIEKAISRTQKKTQTSFPLVYTKEGPPSGVGLAESGT